MYIIILTGAGGDHTTVLGAVRVCLGLDAAELEVPVRVAAEQGVQVAHELVDVALACKVTVLMSLWDSLCMSAESILTLKNRESIHFG